MGNGTDRPKVCFKRSQAFLFMVEACQRLTRIQVDQQQAAQFQRFFDADVHIHVAVSTQATGEGYAAFFFRQIKITL